MKVDSLACLYLQQKCLFSFYIRVKLFEENLFRMFENKVELKIMFEKTVTIAWVPDMFWEMTHEGKLQFLSGQFRNKSQVSRNSQVRGLRWVLGWSCAQGYSRNVLEES